MPTLFLYARKSTYVEDKQIMSIDAQLAELREFAQREGLTIASELIEKQSAKTPGRPIFNDMLARIQRGEAEGILAWHPDRLARADVHGLSERRVASGDGEEEAGTAMGLLRRAADLGYRNVYAFRTESALASLHHRPDFRSLLMDLAMPAEPFAR